MSNRNYVVGSTIKCPICGYTFTAKNSDKTYNQSENFYCRYCDSKIAKEGYALTNGFKR